MESKMADATYQYPFDYTGAATTNKVVGEKHILTRNNYSDFHYIIPKFAPYFEHSLVMTFVGTDGTRRTLVEGIDWYCTHKFKEASLSTAHPIYGSVTFLNNNLAGVVTIGYQTLGGKWTIDTKAIQDILAADIQNPRTTYWEEIVNLPERFPVTNHDFNIIDFTGMSDVRDSLTKIEQAIRTSKGTVGVDHVDRRDNPHDVTKAQVQLGNVLNLPILPATMGANNTNSYYMTPVGVRSIIDHYVKEAFNAHVADRNNPHGTTPALIGTLTTAQINTLLNGKLNNNATAYNTHRFNGLSPEDFKSFVLEGTAKDSERIDGRSYQQLVADIVSSVNASTSSGGLTENEVINVMSNNTAANAVTWNSRTESQYATWLNDNGNLDAKTLDGNSINDIMLAVRTEINASGSITQTDLDAVIAVVDAVRVKAEANEAAITDLDDAMTNVENNFNALATSLTNALGDTNNRVVNLEATFSATGTTLVALDTRLTTLEADFGNIAGLVSDAIDLKITDIDRRITAAEQTASDAGAAVALVESNLNQLSSAYTDMSDDYAQHLTDTATKFTDLDTLIASNAQIVTDHIATYATDKAALEQSVLDLGALITTNTNAIGTLETDLTTLSTDFSAHVASTSRQIVTMVQVETANAGDPFTHMVNLVGTEKIAYVDATTLLSTDLLKINVPNAAFDDSNGVRFEEITLYIRTLGCMRSFDPAFIKMNDANYDDTMVDGIYEFKLKRIPSSNGITTGVWSYAVNVQ